MDYTTNNKVLCYILTFLIKVNYSSCLDGNTLLIVVLRSADALQLCLTNSHLVASIMYVVMQSINLPLSSQIFAQIFGKPQNGTCAAQSQIASGQHKIVQCQRFLCVDSEQPGLVIIICVYYGVFFPNKCFVHTANTCLPLYR